MLDRLWNWLEPAVAVLRKDAVCELRSRYSISVLTMFALVTLSAISMSIGGAVLAPELAAVLLWVTIFFSAMAGLSRVFVQEQESGTLFTLRVYVPAQAVLIGKLAFNILLLAGLSILILPLFIVFFNISGADWLWLAVIAGAGIIGMASLATLTAALVAETQGKGSLFTILTFPVLLPQFLACIQATAAILAGDPPSWLMVGFILGYDVCIAIASSILFDYLWRD